LTAACNSDVTDRQLPAECRRPSGIIVNESIAASWPAFPAARHHQYHHYFVFITITIITPAAEAKAPTAVTHTHTHTENLLIVTAC